MGGHCSTYVDGFYLEVLISVIIGFLSFFTIVRSTCAYLSSLSIGEYSFKLDSRNKFGKFRSTTGCDQMICTRRIGNTLSRRSATSKREKNRPNNCKTEWINDLVFFISLFCSIVIVVCIFVFIAYAQFCDIIVCIFWWIVISKFYYLK